MKLFAFIIAFAIPFTLGVLYTTGSNTFFFAGDYHQCVIVEKPNDN